MFYYDAIRNSIVEEQRTESCSEFPITKCLYYSDGEVRMTLKEALIRLPPELQYFCKSIVSSAGGDVVYPDGVYTSLGERVFDYGRGAVVEDDARCIAEEVHDAMWKSSDMLLLLQDANIPQSLSGRGYEVYCLMMERRQVIPTPLSSSIKMPSTPLFKAWERAANEEIPYSERSDIAASTINLARRCYADLMRLSIIDYLKDREGCSLL